MSGRVWVRGLEEGSGLGVWVRGLGQDVSNVVLEKPEINPLVPALQGRGMPEPNANSTPIPEKDLPRCQEDGCDSLVRPHVVWFGESLNDEVLRKTDEELESCDLCLVVGTSSVVYPAAMFAPMLASRGVTVAEFNMEETKLLSLKYHFHGAAGEFVPQALARHESEPVE
ncbi:putative NAD-dependent protein deacylase sirtuin-5, mitochondrial-like [Apostichopus japonicus]|uniref:Putative NAD-dependent protein deacylase sirtuin-5, mitochondrial-like n=1 Tax=Stichopus japonicus TaxID=307972 RepID=A0A2G8K660_STIJA|nr:putative NAD-dependent protein deacylase sirtuin-5, mitochondrial-like [Apostichopus japonicus]